MEDYSARLTGEPFLYSETKIIASYLLDGYSSSELRQKNLTENLIQYKTKSALSRVNTPIFERLSVFNEEMLDTFVNGDLETSRLLLVYAIMKKDLLVRDFIIDVYQENILVMKDYIEQIEIYNWFDRKYAESENLSKISESTQYKLRQVMMKIMTDSGLVAKEDDRYRIIIPIFSDRFKNLLDSVGDSDYYKSMGGII